MKCTLLYCEFNQCVYYWNNEAKLDETILSSELKIDSYGQREVALSLVTLKVRLHVVTKTVFAATSKVFLLAFICLNLSQSYLGILYR